jgi:hypothetical protein
VEASDAAIGRLEALIGEWGMELEFPGGPVLSGASTMFEWILDGRYVLQRTTVPDPDAPDSATVISVDPASGEYTQHYFDARGVTRVYAMTLSDSEWTLAREKADFSPLDFAQRFLASLSEDRRTIAGRWETRSDGSDWQLDFRLTYKRV